MHITLERSTLLKSLDHIRGVVEKRNTIPVLSNVLVQASGGRVTLTATDLDIEVSESFEAGVIKTGATTVPAHMFREIVSKMPVGGQITLAIEDANGGQAVLKSGRSKFTLATLPREDFPVMEAGTMRCSFTMPAAALAALIAKVKISMSTEETRYYLNGFYLEAKDNRLRAVSTDGHRLTRYDTDLPEGAAELAGIIVPRRTAGEIYRLLNEAGGDVTFSASDAKIMLSFGDITIKSKLIDGKFPPYERVIPQGNANSMDVEVGEMSAALDRVSVVLSDRTALVKMNMGGMNLTMTTRNPGSADAVDEIPVEYHGTALEIGFNSRYLKEILGGLGTSSAKFMLGDAGTPAIIEGVGEGHTLYLLMPIRC